MAEDENGQEKTEDPTSRKLEKATEDGDIARSKELTTTFVLVGGVLGLISYGGELAESMKRLMRYNFVVDREAFFDEQLMLSHLSDTAMAAMQALMPFMIVLAAAAFVGPLMLGGWMFSAKALAPKFNRLNPVTGLGRMFSAKSLVELVKAFAKFVLVFSISCFIFIHYEMEILSLSMSSTEEAIVHSIQVISSAVLVISSATIVIAAFDVPYQLHTHSKKLKMTLQEVKDEMKDSEGKPEVKGRIRQLQHEMAQRRMMSAVPEADVIITNPEHFSVALKYDLEGSKAPVVVAKGTDFMAIKIREIGAANDVLIMQAPPLARAIYYTTDLDQEIPGALYMVVAQVLAYVFQLKAHKQGEGVKPKPIKDIIVPEEVQYTADGALINPKK